MTDYPLNTDESREYLQERQGWSVKAMRDEIEHMKFLIENMRSRIDLRDEIIDEQNQVIEKQKRQLAMYEIKAHNALQFLELVNCGNLDQAKVRQAILVLEDIDKRRNAI